MKESAFSLLLFLAVHLALGQEITRHPHGGSFTLHYDSVAITIRPAPGKLVVTSHIATRNLTQVSAYTINNSTVSDVSIFFGKADDSSATPIAVHDFSVSDFYVYQFPVDNIAIGFKTTNQSLYSILSVNGNENLFPLYYFFTGDDLALINARDSSRRYVDSMTADYGYARFSAFIDKRMELMKHQIRLNGYWIQFDPDEFEMIKGKRVEISGKIINRVSPLCPCYPRAYTPSGNRILSAFRPPGLTIINKKITVQSSFTIIDF